MPSLQNTMTAKKLFLFCSTCTFLPSEVNIYGISAHGSDRQLCNTYLSLAIVFLFTLCFIVAMKLAQKAAETSYKVHQKYVDQNQNAENIYQAYLLYFT